MYPALPPLPPLQMSSGATAGATGGGIGAQTGIASGDWYVNTGGGNQGMGTNTWLLIAMAVGAFLLLRKSKG